MYREHAPAVAAIGAVAAYDPAVRDYWDGELAGFAAVAEARLTRDQVAGRTAADLDPAAAAAMMTVWGGDQVLRRHVALGQRRDDSSIARELAHSQWYGFFRRQR